MESHGSFSRLVSERVNEKLEGCYGLSKEGARIDGGKFSELGFDKESNRLGWTVSNVSWILENPRMLESVAEDARKISERYRNVVFCGMGGSGLSVETVKSVFGEWGPKIHGLRTTDGAVLAQTVQGLKEPGESLRKALEKTLVIPISKSGTTAETVSHQRYFTELFEKTGLDPKEHMWVMTDTGSPMDTGEFPQREIQLNRRGDIGGRYTSPTTRVFLLPAALTNPEGARQRLEDILKRAKDENACDIKEDKYLRLAGFLYDMAKKGKDKLTFIVPEGLKDIPMWSEQLFEESLGKGGKGITVFYGEDLKPDNLKPPEESDRVFLRLNLGGEKPQPELWDSLTMGGHPAFEIGLENPNSVGGLMLGLERTVASIGYLWDINFVDQPAVEGYKNATLEEMDKIKPGERVTVPKNWSQGSAGFKGLTLYYQPVIEAGGLEKAELDAEIKSLGGSSSDAPAAYAAVLSILYKKGGFEAAETASYGKMTPKLNETMQQARRSLFTKVLRVPSKLGEGPDKNHSYQQNVEDGKPGLFFSTYLAFEESLKPPVVEYDENLLRAPTIGTIQSMIRNRRNAVLLLVDGTARDSEKDIGEFFEKTGEYLRKAGLKDLPADGIKA